MANFFDEQRFECDKCHSQVMEEITALILVKDKSVYEKQPYKKMYRCISCGKIHEIKVRD